MRPTSSSTSSTRCRCATPTRRGPRRSSTACLPGHRYWYGFPVASELPFDRGGLGSQGLSSSAQDMTRYLSLYLNQWPTWRHHAGLTRRCRRTAAGRSPHRPGRRLLRDGLGRGPDPRHHDDLPRRQRLRLPRKRRPHPRPRLGRRGDGERGELPGRVLRFAPHDRHRLRRRRHADRRGATRDVSSSWSLWVVYGVVLGILVIQVAGMVRSVRTIRTWRTVPSRRPTGALRIALRVGLPLLVSWTWALLVLVGLPRVIRAPLPAVLMGLPDLGYPLVASAVLAFGWGLARFIWAIRTLRTPPSQAPRPSTGATTDLIPATG